METQTITVRRNLRNELTAANYFETAKPGYKLRVSTWKGSRGVMTNYQAVEQKGDTESFIMFQDFSKSIQHPELKRATVKTIAQGQQIGIAKVEEILKEFNQHYKIEEKVN